MTRADAVGESHTESDRGWPLWGEAIQRALDRRNVSINSAAGQLGLRNATLKKWLAGEVPPQLSRLPQIADLTGISHAVQLELGGALPSELCAEAHAIQVTEELRRATNEVINVLTRASELAFSDAGARLAGVLLAEGEERLQVTLRRAHRGQRYQVHLSTYVGIDSIKPSNLTHEQLRLRVTQVIGKFARAFGARWREQEAHDWPPPQPQLILNVPQHERPRPPSAEPAQAVPNVLMLGCPYAHAEYVGALLADALGYGYLDVRYSVPLSLDTAPTDPLVTAARLQFAEDRARNEALTNKHVWSLTDHRVLPSMGSVLEDAPVGCIVYLRSQDALLRRGGEVWNIPDDEMEALRETLDDLVAKATCPVLTVEMPTDLITDDEGQVDRDRIADLAMLAAVDVWQDMRRYRLALGSPRGRLASMFDARDRPIGDPRLSLVRERMGMPRQGAGA